MLFVRADQGIDTQSLMGYNSRPLTKKYNDDGAENGWSSLYEMLGVCRIFLVDYQPTEESVFISIFPNQSIDTKFSSDTFNALAYKLSLRSDSE